MTWDYTVPFEVKVTMEGNLFTIRDALKLEIDDSQCFHTQIDKLLYVAKRTRPDILLSIFFLTTRVQSRDEDDMNKLV